LSQAPWRPSLKSSQKRNHLGKEEEEEEEEEEEGEEEGEEGEEDFFVLFQKTHHN